MAELTPPDWSEVVQAISDSWENEAMVVSVDCEDTVASDRTFENETKLHKRSPIRRDDWLF